MRRVVKCVHILVGFGLLFTFGLLGQQNNSFQGSVPGGAASAAPLALTLDDAIRRGLKFNLGLLESQTANQTARAERIQALSALLPQVTGMFSETEEQLNLKMFGFSVRSNAFITIPTIAGPFSYTTVQANASARVVDFNARRNLKSARANEAAAQTFGKCLARHCGPSGGQCVSSRHRRFVACGRDESASGHRSGAV